MSERCLLRGIAASHGIAVGRAVCLTGPGLHVPHARIDPSQVDAEIERLRAAIAASRQALEASRESLRGAGSELEVVLDAHLLMHGDELLVDGCVRSIRDERINAEWALARTIEAICAQLSAAGPVYLRHRAADVQQVGHDILRWLTGTASPLPELSGPAVLVAEDLSPAHVARLVDRPVLAVVTDLGSASGHTAILARALEIPAVVGVLGISRMAADGDLVLVDALHGDVVIHPTEQECARAEERGRRYRRFTRRLRERHATGSAVTKDGVPVRLLANVEIPSEAALAAELGAEGIGLYRTEFLYLDRAAEPDEEEQARVYADVVRVMAPRRVVFRTYDLGGDKLPDADPAFRSPNPALGLRAVRLSLARPAMFRAQLRAMLRAAVHGPVDVMVPLVATVGELREARRHFDETRAELLARGLALGSTRFGIMVEVPSAALLADALASECEFFSVGTNDLVQYTLAVDRTHPQIAGLARPLDPSVLRLLDSTSRAAHAHGIGLSMCGDMASDPIALPVVLGLGYETLSMPYSALPLVREVVGRIEARLARRTAEEALRMGSADDVVALVESRFGKVLGDLWTEEGLREPRASARTTGARGAGRAATRSEERAGDEDRTRGESAATAPADGSRGTRERS
ncbi:MAG: phosphoenolpyruvate--protein phosphotransferase [Myxococcota bacterium]|nr:phosphoenolpyruvate--protein phosphotransferase [Myxococcota bacterium]MDW8361492.1 phosphoenolpyruvate--protein phosphotransferase [Myxococcales bacterium]